MLYIGTSDQQVSVAASAVSQGDVLRSTDEKRALGRTDLRTDRSTDPRPWAETRAPQEMLRGYRLRQAGRCATHASRTRNSEAGLLQRLMKRLRDIATAPASFLPVLAKPVTR